MLCIAAAVAPTANANAALRLPRLVSDNMVLQRDAPAVVWGFAAPRENITVTLHGRRSATRTDAQGRWQVILPALPAGGPYELTVAGTRTVTLKNILLGDVWLASGQSNMQFPLVTHGNFGGVVNAEREQASANHPQIRLYRVNRTTASSPQTDVESSGWMVVTPGSVADFSAVGYLFGRELHQRYHVPIGVIDATWGGTPAETWMSAETAVPAPPAAAMHPGVPQDPALLFDGMIAPLTPFRLKGIIWYQGEANVDRAAQYRTVFPLLIRDWRRAWGAELPFLFVQLAGYGQDPADPGDAPWAQMREAQSAALDLPATGMATAVDVGEATDVHPKNKQAVAHRLALAAFRVAYGESAVATSPAFRSQQIEGGTIRIRFTDGGPGLHAADAQGRLRGFTIAGADGRFVRAEARIERDTVVVGNPAIEHPVAVRYDWANMPQGNLYNQAGLPALPFRSDGPWQPVRGPTRP